MQGIACARARACVCVCVCVSRAEADLAGRVSMCVIPTRYPLPMPPCLFCPAAARAAAFRPLGAALASTAAPLLSDAASLGTLAAKLQPLVADAQAAADARRGGGGWPATRDTTGGATDVERRVRAAMADARASLEQLAAANEALSGGA
jgi:hypothetical protein